MAHNRIRDFSQRRNQQQKSQNDSDIFSFVCLPSLPDWVIRQLAPGRKETYRLAVERAKAEVDPGIFGI